MRNRRLGTSDLVVSEVGFGAWTIATDWWGKVDDKAGLVHAALDAGVTFFDTAPVYGDDGFGETILAEILGCRDDVIVTTKVGYDIDAPRIAPGHSERPQDWRPESVRSQVEASLRRLGRDHIDLLQLHNPPLSLISRAGTWEPLEEMKHEGLIRFYGLSVHPPEEGVAAVQATMPDTVQIVYNLARREAEDTFLATAQAANVGVIAREPLANGFLAGRYNAASTWEHGDIRSRMPRPYVAQLCALGQRVRELAEQSGMTAAQLALKFVLDRTEIACAIVGMKTVQQVEENLN